MPRDRNAVLFVAVSLLLGFGGSMMAVASGIWVLDLSRSSSLAGLVGLCVYLPTLAGPWLGGYADRRPRRPLLVRTSIFAAVAMACLVAVRSPARIWLIFAVMLAYGVAVVLIDAADNALLAGAVPAAAIGTVNGLRTSAQEGAKLVAPVAGAAVFAWYGGPEVAALTALVLAGVAVLYALIRPGPVAPPGPARPGAATGLRFLWRHRTLRGLVGAGAVTIAMSGVATPAVFAVVVDVLHRPPEFVGVLASAQGAGSILGGLLAGRLMGRAGEAGLSALGALLFAAGTVARALPWWPATVAGSVVVGIGLPWTLVAAVTAVQRLTPDDLLGRVTASTTTALFAPVAPATAIGAALVLADGRLALAAAAIGAATAAATTARTQLRGRLPLPGRQ